MFSRSPESGNLFHIDALREWYGLSDYISDGYPTFCTDPHNASIHIKIECEAKELSDIRQYDVLE